MRTKRFLLKPLVASLAALTWMVAVAQTRDYNLPAGDLKTALDAYAAQSGVQLIYKVDDLAGLSTKGVKGSVSSEQALTALLDGTSLAVRRDSSNAILIFRGVPSELPAKGAADEAASLGTVTVTAQRRPEAAQSVPISLTTFSGATIENQRIQSLQDVSRLTPGLLVSAFSKNNPTIAIRGTSNTFSQMGVSKPVAVVVDDVFIPRNSAANFELFDLESIAVLKGPQGTLFGRNVTGGAIVINTRKPNFDERESAVQASFGNRNDRQFSGMINVPFTDSVALKLSGSTHKRDGYGVDRLTGRQEDDIDSNNLRAQLRLAPSDKLDVLLSADTSRDTNGGRTLSSNTLGDDGNRRTSELGADQGFARTIAGASARIAWSTDVGDLISITAYRQSQTGEDYSGVGANYSLLTTGAQSLVRDADQVGTFSQEFRYASPKWQYGDFVSGLYLLDENGTRQLGTRGLAARTGALTSYTYSEQSVKTTSYALYLDGTAHLLPSVDMSAGVRYTSDKKTASLTRTDLIVAANTFSARDQKGNWHEWTPRIALNWRVIPQAMTYVSATRGFTAGGFNTEASSLRAFAIPFDPETVTNYEAGLKSQWFNNRLRFNVSYFNMKYKDKQELVNNTATGILNIFNASSATVKGAEVELAYRPVRWLGVSAQYAKLNAIYDSFVVATVNNTGNPLGSSPRNTYSAALDLNVPVGSVGYVLATASYSHTDEYYTGATKDPNLLIPHYGLANASLGFENADRSLRVMAWIKNIANTDYILTRSTQVVRSEYLGEPRSFGVTFSAKF